MLLALKRTTSPVVGWRQERAASSTIRGARSPASAGALNKGPMIENRSRAQRTRAEVSVSLFIASWPLAFGFLQQKLSVSAHPTERRKR
jgi:hypothetical protein